MVVETLVTAVNGSELEVDAGVNVVCEVRIVLVSRFRLDSLCVSVPPPSLTELERLSVRISDGADAVESPVGECGRGRMLVCRRGGEGSALIV